MLKILPAPFGTAEIVTSTVELVLGLIVIGLRLWARVIKKKRFATGDYLIVLAWFLAFSRHAMKLIVYGWLERDPNHMLVVDSRHAIKSMKIIFSSVAIWAGSITCVKLSILFVYIELFYVIAWIERCAWSMIVISVALLFLNTIGLLTICTPLARNYNPSVPGTCRIKLASALILSTVFNLVIDITLVVIPLSSVWKLKITYPKKIAVSLMFGLGFGIVAIAAIRVHSFRTETISNNYRLAFLCSLELHLGMISACLPFLGPPLAKIRDIVCGSCFGSFPQMHTIKSPPYHSKVESKCIRVLEIQDVKDLGCSSLAETRS